MPEQLGLWTDILMLIIHSLLWLLFYLIEVIYPADLWRKPRDSYLFLMHVFYAALVVQYRRRAPGARCYAIDIGTCLPAPRVLALCRTSTTTSLIFLLMGA